MAEKVARRSEGVLKSFRMKKAAGVTEAGTWDRSEKVVRETTGSEKVVPKIRWRRQYIFRCHISFRDPIDTSRFHFGVEQKNLELNSFDQRRGFAAPLRRHCSLPRDRERTGQRCAVVLRTVQTIAEMMPSPDVPDMRHIGPDNRANQVFLNCPAKQGPSSRFRCWPFRSMPTLRP
jgi:hypothetical protein